MSPLVGPSSPAIRLRVVVLPHPDGPTNTVNSPSGMTRSTSRTARVVPNVLLSFARRTPATALFPDQAEAEAAHQMLLDDEAEHDHRQGGDGSDGRLRPVGAALVGGLELVEGDGDGR